MEKFDYSMVDLKLIDMCKAVSPFYYEDCEQLLTEVLRALPDYTYVYNKLLNAIKEHYYFDEIEDLKSYLRGE